MLDARPFLIRLLGLVAAIILFAAACGDDDDGAADVEGDDGGTEELSADEDAYCAHSVEMAGRQQLAEGSTPEAVEAYYDQLLADLEQAASLAPPELSGDYAVVSQVFDGVAEIIEAVDFDLEAAQDLLNERATDPVIDAAMQEAIANVEAYDIETCGF